jgi:hypothetical protein
MGRILIQLVMAGLVPAIHVLILIAPKNKDVDARDKPGHDDLLRCAGLLNRPCANGKTPLRLAPGDFLFFSSR